MENLKCCLNTSSPDCIFWPSVKLCFCIKERGVYIRAEKKSSKIHAQTWQYVVPSFLVFPEPSTALFTFPSRALGCPFFFFQISLPQTHALPPVTSLPCFCSLAVPWRAYIFSFHSTGSDCMEEIPPSLPAWLVQRAAEALFLWGSLEYTYPSACGIPHTATCSAH